MLCSGLRLLFNFWTFFFFSSRERDFLSFNFVPFPQWRSLTVWQIDFLLFQLLIRKPVGKHCLCRTLETVCKLTFSFKISLEATAAAVSVQLQSISRENVSRCPGCSPFSGIYCGVSQYTQCAARSNSQIPPKQIWIIHLHWNELFFPNYIINTWESSLKFSAKLFRSLGAYRFNLI